MSMTVETRKNVYMAIYTVKVKGSEHSERIFSLNALPSFILFSTLDINTQDMS